VSGKRRRLHDRLDFLRGTATPSGEGREQIERLEEEERELSARRRDLHVEIDALRVTLGLEPGPRERPPQLGG